LEDLGTDVNISKCFEWETQAWCSQ